jgi:hypothetical protein
MSQAMRSVDGMEGLLATIEHGMGDDLAARSDEGLRSLSSQVNRGIALLEGFATRIAGEARRREAAGSDLVAEEVVRGQGEVAHGRACALAARAGLGDTLPRTGAAAEFGGGPTRERRCVDGHDGRDVADRAGAPGTGRWRALQSGGHRPAYSPVT